MTVTAATQPKTITKTVGGKTVTMTPEQAEAFGRELDALKEIVTSYYYSGSNLQAINWLQRQAMQLYHGYSVPPWKMYSTLAGVFIAGTIAYVIVSRLLHVASCRVHIDPVIRIRSVDRVQKSLRARR